MLQFFAEIGNLFSALGEITRALGLVSSEGDGVNSFFSIFAGVLKAVTLPMRGVIKLMTEIINAFLSLKNFVSGVIDSFTQFISKFEASKIAIDAVKSAFNSVAESVSDFLQYIGVLDSAEEKQAKKRKKQAQELELQKKKELQDTEKLAKEQEKINQQQSDKRKQRREKEKQELIKFEEDKRNIRDKLGLTSEIEYYNRDLDLLKSHLAQKIISETEYEEQKKALREQFESELIPQKIEALNNDVSATETASLEKVKIQEAEAVEVNKLAQLTGEKQLNIVADTTSRAANLFQQNTIAYKALASGTALIDTYAAANAAYKATAGIAVVGPFLAPIQAGLAVASGLANVAKINGIGFAHGGYTGDGAKYQPAGVVHAGEFVFTKEQTAALGVGNLASIAQGYANGGIVGNTVNNRTLTNTYNTTNKSVQPVLVVENLDQVRGDMMEVGTIESN